MSTGLEAHVKMVRTALCDGLRRTRGLDMRPEPCYDFRSDRPRFRAGRVVMHHDAESASSHLPTSRPGTSRSRVDR